MVRRNSDQELNPEEFLERNGNNQDGEEGNELMEILRGVKGSQEEDALVENSPIAVSGGDLAGPTTDEQWDDPASAEKTPDRGEDATDPENEEPDWEPEAETLEVLDDPVRMYLREIGRVRLLTSKDERSLARKIEGGKHLLALEAELNELEGRQPRK